jgi:hypothetical protein
MAGDPKPKCADKLAMPAEVEITLSARDGRITTTLCFQPNVTPTEPTWQHSSTDPHE